MTNPGSKIGRFLWPSVSALMVLALSASAAGLATGTSTTNGTGRAVASPVSNLCKPSDPSLGYEWASWQIVNLSSEPLVVTISPSPSSNGYETITVPVGGFSVAQYERTVETFTWSTGSVTERAGQACQTITILAGGSR